MLKFHASAYMDLCKWLSDIEGAATYLTGVKHDKVSSDLADVEAFQKTRSACTEIGLNISLAQLERMVQYIHAESITYEELGRMAKDLRLRIYDEADTKLFLYVPPERAAYFTGDSFGDSVAKHFPACIKDASEAGKCLAVGRGTATVFHLMRVMEDALKYLAGRLSIPYAPSWESYITQITVQVKEKHAHKTVDWKRDEEFFKEILGDMVAIKTAWRNPTMHIVQHYDPDEAEDIFRSVRILMRRLAADADTREGNDRAVNGAAPI